MEPTARVGAHYQPDGRCVFRLWAPAAREVALNLVTPEPRLIPMAKRSGGYHEISVDAVQPGARYFFRLDGTKDRPDPASAYQPEGVHGPSAVVDQRFGWTDQHWFGLPLSQYIIYELHVGTFTPQGTFEAIIPRLRYLKELGITAIELMPIAQFPGGRNWGYDGVGLFAVQNTYGGPEGLKRLVNACHQEGIAVVLDVVYNHLGPEGNYLADFGPYFTTAYSTPWGPALNYDGPDSCAVRNFFLQNALYWQTEFHIDALRLDAVHAIKDFSALPFMEELATATRERSEAVNRRFYLIAENDLNNPRFVLPQSIGGYGLEAQWSDDFHHALHVLLTGENNGYYEDFGGVEQLAKVFREGYVYTGEYSRHRKRKHGTRTHLTGAKQFVVCSQNHDQIGNRFRGDRLTESLSFEELKLAAGIVLLSPFIPLLFMGEEYGETAPFQYFISHTDPELVEAVRKGRKEEFSSFGWNGEVPDPQHEGTFAKCKLNFGLSEQGHHPQLLKWYKELIRFRKAACIHRVDKPQVSTQVAPEAPVLCVRYSMGGGDLLLISSFADSTVDAHFAAPAGDWHNVLDSNSKEWGGSGGNMPERLTSSGTLALSINPKSFVVWRKT